VSSVTVAPCTYRLCCCIIGSRGQCRRERHVALSCIYCSRGESVRFAYVTSLWAEGKQTHILWTKMLPTQEMRPLPFTSNGSRAHSFASTTVKDSNLKTTKSVNCCQVFNSRTQFDMFVFENKEISIKDTQGTCFTGCTFKIALLRW
jgi:hypothetical protein